MSNVKRGLGRGLGALIPSAAPPSPAVSQALIVLDIERIAPNPRQPRQHFDNEALQELAASIREHGLIQPLIVTRATATGGADYFLIAGERRWRAARLAGLQQAPAIVKEASDQAVLEMALVENVQRADLNPLEEAAAYNMLIEEFGLTQAQVATRVGKARVTVTNLLRLLRLSQPVKEALLSGDLSEAQARPLVGLDEELQIEALAIIRHRHMTARQVEDLVHRLTLAAATEDATADAPANDEQALHVLALENSLRQRLGTKVELIRGARGRGRLVIHFYSDEELQTVIAALGEPA